MITVITPVTGDYFEDTAMLRKYLSSHLKYEKEIEFRQIPYGYSTIESELQGMVNGTMVAMEYMKGFATDCRGVVVDCFDDPGVAACKEIGTMPVVGAYQAAVATASVIADRIGIITTDVPGITNEEKKARAIGAEKRISAIRALDFSVDNIIENKDALLAALIKLCLKMEKEDRVSAICLGCTAMFPIADELKIRLKETGSKLSIIEPILNAALTLENIIIMNCGTQTPVEVSFDNLKWY